jgi:AraC-like DNA-binding protein
LYDRRILDAPREWVRAWKPAVPGIHEVFHASFAGHAYPPHTHDTWTVFIVDDGAVRYDIESRHRGTTGVRVTLLPPHVAHDGRAATEHGYRKRVLYLGADVLGEDLIGPSIDRPDVDDPRIVRGIGALHRVLEDPDAVFEAEARLALVVDRLRGHLGERRVERADANVIAVGLRDLLDDRTGDPPTLAEAAGILHASPAHAVRCFTRAFGIAPHRYVIGRRIDAARRRLLDGEPTAQVATEVGFHDQAHLTRHFRRHVGVPPARYATSAAR